MQIKQGLSKRTDPRRAVAEATAGWDAAPEMVLAFSSMEQDPQGVAEALAERFPDRPIAGCTTAGEHLGGEHANGSVAVVGVYDSSITWSLRVVRGLDDLDAERAEALVDGMFTEIGQDREEIEPSEHFALLLIDGLSLAEERVTSVLAEALEGIPLAGGSAGDDLRFEETRVISREGAFSDAAVLVVGNKGRASVELLKHQHYVTTPRALCITKADPATRTVHEIDGYPAIDAYAAALGMTRDEVTDEVTFLNPVIFSIDGEIYVRSIQQVSDDGSMTFYCAIEEGMVLEIGGHESMRDVLERDLDRFTAEKGRPELVIGFNCILRALEAAKAEEHEALGALVRERSGAMIGFDTYGEQLNGLHINQTLVAVAFREEEASR